ncbi:MAG: hypothetical protein ACE5EQ_12270 [Phycisphaerae bacterium]
MTTQTKPTEKTRIVLNPYPDESWFWPVLDEYRDASGRTLIECERDVLIQSEPEHIDTMLRERSWKTWPKPAHRVEQMIQVITAFRNPNEPIGYLEFGTCWGTTFLSVMQAFPKARGTGLEITPHRCEVSRWMVKRTGDNRSEIRNESITQAKLDTESIDVVFMDTNHGEDDYDFIRHVLDSGWLRRHWLFVCDDPNHSGTKIARERLMRDFDDTYKIITRPDINLWWFWK